MSEAEHTIAAPSTRACAVDLRIERVDHICAEHVLIEAVAPNFPTSQPGQFLQLLCAENDDERPAALSWVEGSFPHPVGRDWSAQFAYLRRPFSIADRFDSSRGAHLSVISRAIGPGTRWLDGLNAGGTLNVTGPLGRGFVFPDTAAPVILVGGGVGIPPLLYAARELARRGFDDVVCILGVMRKDLLPIPLVDAPNADGTPKRCVRLPGDAPYPAIITTDDGSLGMRGFAVAGLRAAPKHRRSDEAPLVLACGPERMLDSIAAATRELQWPCQLCIERHMGCGLGTCLSCIVKVHAPDQPAGWRWALSCLEGPVFERDRLCEVASQ
jgi:dihydroorotate dehydrogenase electron transfer subunit